MKKLIAVAAIGLLSAVEVYAADVGVGVNENGDSRTILVPINLSEQFRIEPYFSTYKQNEEGSYNYRYSEVGVGAFKVSEIANKTNLLLGVRAAYVDGRTSGDDFDGYTFAPVLGFEYFPVKNISLGADVALQYTSIEGREDLFGDTKTTETKTSVGVKFYF